MNIRGRSNCLNLSFVSCLEIIFFYLDWESFAYISLSFDTLPSQQGFYSYFINFMSCQISILKYSRCSCSIVDPRSSQSSFCPSPSSGSSHSHPSPKRYAATDPCSKHPCVFMTLRSSLLSFHPRLSSSPSRSHPPFRNTQLLVSGLPSSPLSPEPARHLRRRRSRRSTPPLSP